MKPEIYRGIEIRTYDLPHAPFVWTHGETDGYGTAGTLTEAKAQIDRHL